MIDSLISFQKKIEQEISDNTIDISAKKYQFEQNLKNLQHEREMHLYVTLTVGLAALISCFVTIFKPMLPLFILDILFCGLFIAYIFHYRSLENRTQHWYELQNKLMGKKTDFAHY